MPFPITSHIPVSNADGAPLTPPARPADSRRYLDDEPDSEEEAAIRRQEEEEEEAAEAEDYDLRDMGEFERAAASAASGIERDGESGCEGEGGL